MAKTTVIKLTCDRCASENGSSVEGAESVTLGIDGFAYEADLCRMHLDEFHRFTQTFVGYASGRTAARPISASRPVGAGGRGEGRTDKARLDAIRTWARDNNMAVSERGRIAGTVVSAFDAAHE